MSYSGIPQAKNRYAGSQHLYKPGDQPQPLITSRDHVVPSQTGHASGMKSLKGTKATLPMLLLLATSESDAAVIVGDDPHQRYLCGGISGGCSCSLEEEICAIYQRSGQSDHQLSVTINSKITGTTCSIQK